MNAHIPVAGPVADDILREDRFMTDGEETRDEAVGALDTESLESPHQLAATGAIHLPALRLESLQTSLRTLKE